MSGQHSPADSLYNVTSLPSLLSLKMRTSPSKINGAFSKNSPSSIVKLAGTVELVNHLDQVSKSK
nr:hypothetical protein [Brevibacillus brevis]